MAVAHLDDHNTALNCIMHSPSACVLCNLVHYCVIITYTLKDLKSAGHVISISYVTLSPIEDHYYQQTAEKDSIPAYGDGTLSKNFFVKQ